MSNVDEVFYHDEALDIKVTKNPKHSTYHVKGAGTFKIQDPLKQLNSRVRYYSGSNYWTVPTDSFDNLIALLIAVQRGEIPLVDAPAPSGPSSPGEQEPSAPAQVLPPDFVSATGVTVAKDPSLPVYRVAGNTFPLKDKIKALDSRVRGFGKGPTFYWSVPEESYQALMALLEAAAPKAEEKVEKSNFQTVTLRLTRPVVSQQFAQEGDFSSEYFTVTRADPDLYGMILFFEGVRGQEVAVCELRRDRFVFSQGPVALIGEPVQFFDPPKE